jgi:hypothetical protein
VEVERERIRALDAEKSQGEVRRQDRQRAERSVDVEPQRIARAMQPCAAVDT